MSPNWGDFAEQMRQSAGARQVRTYSPPPPQPVRPQPVQPVVPGPSLGRGLLRVGVWGACFALLCALPPLGVAAATFWAWVLYFYRREKP
jgi:hypothetical protein